SSTAAAARARCSGEGFAVIGHELRLAESDLDKGADNRLRVGIGDAVETVSNGAELYAVELRINLSSAEPARERRGGQGHLSRVSSGDLHDCSLSSSVSQDKAPARRPTALNVRP